MLDAGCASGIGFAESCVLGRRPASHGESLANFQLANIPPGGFGKLSRGDVPAAEFLSFCRRCSNLPHRVLSTYGRRMGTENGAHARSGSAAVQQPGECAR
jgi:hypothetical protein